MASSTGYLLTFAVYASLLALRAGMRPAQLMLPRMSDVQLLRSWLRIR